MVKSIPVHNVFPAPSREREWIKLEQKLNDLPDRHKLDHIGNLNSEMEWRLKDLHDDQWDSKLQMSNPPSRLNRSDNTRITIRHSDADTKKSTKAKAWSNNVSLSAWLAEDTRINAANNPERNRHQSSRSINKTTCVACTKISNSKHLVV